MMRKDALSPQEHWYKRRRKAIEQRLKTPWEIFLEKNAKAIEWLASACPSVLLNDVIIPIATEDHFLDDDSIPTSPEVFHFPIDHLPQAVFCDLGRLTHLMVQVVDTFEIESSRDVGGILIPKMYLCAFLNIKIIFNDDYISVSEYELVESQTITVADVNGLDYLAKETDADEETVTNVDDPFLFQLKDVRTESVVIGPPIFHNSDNLSPV